MGCDMALQRHRQSPCPGKGPVLWGQSIARGRDLGLALHQSCVLGQQSSSSATPVQDQCTSAATVQDQYISAEKPVQAEHPVQ